ncbi:hypothetical protein QTP88_013483 [Uroleucon formosanum]
MVLYYTQLECHLSLKSRSQWDSEAFAVKRKDNKIKSSEFETYPFAIVVPSKIVLTYVVFSLIIRLNYLEVETQIKTEMNSFVFIALVTLPVVLSSSAYYYRRTPITLCMKSDYSWCTDVPYPISGCVNMDTVVMNGTGNANSKGNSSSFVTAFKTVEAVIVVDVDSTEDKCIVLYDKYNCQGRSLVLNGTIHPAADLADFNFSNKAESYRQCSDLVLSWLRDNKSN